MRALHAGLLCLVLAAGCKPKLGAACEGDEAACADDETQLICAEGRFVATRCRGPQGCRADPDEGVLCDISQNEPGDFCAKAEEGVAVCRDAHTLLACRGGTYALEPCRGKSGCDAGAGRAHCDRTIAKEGDACHDAGAKACNMKGDALLHCRDQKMSVLFHCRGESGCESQVKLACDFSVAKVGDPCDAKMEGASACSVDGLSIVTCKGGEFVTDEPCKQSEICRPQGSPRCEAP